DVAPHLHLHSFPTRRSSDLSLTLEAWVMFNSVTGTQMIFSKAVGSGTNDSYALWLQNGDIRGGVDTGFLSVSLSPVSLRWYHIRSEEHTSELQSLRHLVCRL